MSNKTWRVAMIGAGFIIQRGHVPAFQKLDNVEVVAICDVAQDRVQAFATQAGIPGVYTDYKTMLAAEKPDLVVIATPNTFHKPMTLDALEAGANVLCEKPLALTYADAQEMVAKAKSVGKVLTVGTHYRWSAPMKACKQHVEAGFFGDIYSVRTVYSRRAGIPGFGSWFTNQDLAGGGCGLDIGVHGLDKALFLMGYPKPVTVTGVTYAKLGPQGKGLGGWGIEKHKPGAGVRFDVEDLALAFVRFENGASLQLQAAWATHMNAMELVEVYGTAGGARVSSQGGLQLYTDLNDEPVVIEQEIPAQSVGSSAAQTADLIRYLDGDTTADIITPDQALIGIQILDAMYRSAQSGREIVFG